MKNLSKHAREEYEKLQAGLLAVIERDRVREPKLTEGERVKVANLEAQAAKMSGILPRLEKDLANHEARFKELTIHATEMVIDGGDPLKIAQEFVVVKQALLILEGALSTVYSQRGLAEGEIQSIKQAARKRELIEEEG